MNLSTENEFAHFGDWGVSLCCVGRSVTIRLHMGIVNGLDKKAFLSSVVVVGWLVGWCQ